MANNVQKIDTSIKIVTPENISFEYRLAGPFGRLLAYVIDLAVRMLVFAVVAIAFAIFVGMAGLGTLGFGLAAVWWFLLSWFYGGFCESYFNGQTPGKRLMNIRVLSFDGQPITGLQAVLRNVLRAIDCQPFMCYSLGLIAASCNDRFQRLGDLASGTMVVIEERPWLHTVSRTGEPAAIQIASSIPADFQASRTLAKALASYVQRRRFFSFGRRMEIARPLAEPLRRQFGLPPNTNLDILLCGLYERTFITDREDESASAGSSPFSEESIVPATIVPEPPTEPTFYGPPWSEEQTSVATVMAERDGGGES